MKSKWTARVTGSSAIWVAAIDPAAPADADPSRPAFLLPGQNMQGRNFRATHVPAQ